MPASCGRSARRSGRRVRGHLRSGRPGTTPSCPPGWPVLQRADTTCCRTGHTPAPPTSLSTTGRRSSAPWRLLPGASSSTSATPSPGAEGGARCAGAGTTAIFDTCRLVNLQLLLEGRTLEVRDVPRLHHVGGVSGATSPGAVRAAAQGCPLLLRSKHHRRPSRIAEYVAFRYFLWRGGTTRAPACERAASLRGRLRGRRPDALDAGEPVPPVPTTGSADIDRRLGALTAAMEGSTGRFLPDGLHRGHHRQAVAPSPGSAPAHPARPRRTRRSSAVRRATRAVRVGRARRPRTPARRAVRTVGPHPLPRPAHLDPIAMGGAACMLRSTRARE